VRHSQFVDKPTLVIVEVEADVSAAHSPQAVRSSSGGGSSGSMQAARLRRIPQNRE
jgi:hypothetical protein